MTTDVAAVHTRWDAGAAAARAAEALVGAVFLVFAVLKALYVNEFIVAIGAYGVLSGDTLSAAAALGTLAVETFLGAALLLGLGPRRLTLGATILLLIGFSGLIVYGWAVHGIQDCGCSGPIAMGPRVSLLKNAVLLALTAGAWWGLHRADAARGQAAKTAVSLLAGALVPLYAFTAVEPAPETAHRPQPFAQFVVEADGLTYDLGQGEYLVAMLSATCEHCMSSVPQLNEFVERNDLPPVIGLMTGDDSSVETFRRDTDPWFPTHLIGTREFYAFLQVPPRFFYIREGRPVRQWDDRPPTAEELTAAMTANPDVGE